MESRVAIIAIIVENRESHDAIATINEHLHESAEYIIGRMGLPYKQKDVSIISIVMDAPQDIISALSGKIGRIEHVQVKTVYSK